MRMPFLNRVPVRKLTVRTSGPGVAQITDAFTEILAQLPDLQLLYLADTRTAQVLSFYTTTTALSPDPLAQEYARLYQRPPQTAGRVSKEPASRLLEVVYVFEQQLHFTSSCHQANWHWGIVVEISDVSLAVVRSVMRAQCAAL